MSRTANVVRLTLPPGRRVLVISDIHGNLPFFKGVLSAARYTPDDVLVLLGDLVEFGKTEQLFSNPMALAERNTVYCVRGNCDNLVSDFALDEGAPEAGFYHHYLNVWRDRCLLVQMGQAAGFETAMIPGVTSFCAVAARLLFGPDNFLLIALIAAVAILAALRGRSEAKA